MEGNYLKTKKKKKKSNRMKQIELRNEENIQNDFKLLKIIHF